MESHSNAYTMQGQLLCTWNMKVFNFQRLFVKQCCVQILLSTTNLHSRALSNCILAWLCIKRKQSVFGLTSTKMYSKMCILHGVHLINDCLPLLLVSMTCHIISAVAHLHLHLVVQLLPARDHQCFACDYSDQYDQRLQTELQ